MKWRSCFAAGSLALVLCLWVTATADAEVGLKFENLAYNKGRTFSFRCRRTSRPSGIPSRGAARRS